MYDGVQVVEIVLGREALWGLRNRNLLPMGSVIQLRNATLEDHSFRVGGGGTRLGDSFGATVTGLAAIDFFADVNTQRTVASGDDGTIRKDNGSGAAWVNLVTGLTTSGQVPFFHVGGAETSGNSRKLFHLDRINAVRVLAADGGSMTVITAPPAAWSGANQPGFGVIHQGFHWAGGAANDGHRIHRSILADHEDFTSTVYSLRVFPGDGERLVAGLSYKGVLILWKYPVGLFAVDTSENSDANWRVIKVGAPGAAGPSNVIAIEDDLMWVAADGTWHLLSATTATGSVRAEDLAARKLGSWHRDNINLARLAWAQMIFYSHKQEVLLACAGTGQTAKNRRLHMDLNRRTELGERWIWWDRDRNESLFLRKKDEIHIPAMVDNVGQVWELDRSDRSAPAGTGFTFEFFLKDTDFSEIVPGWQGRWKNLRFIQLEYDARSAGTVTLEIYGDGSLLQTISQVLSAGPAALPQVLPFTLGTASLLVTPRRRLRGRARRFAARVTSSAANVDVSFTKLLVGLEPGE